MSATALTGSSQEARIDAWLATLHDLARTHRERRAQRFAGRRSAGHHILGARNACAVEGGTDLSAASGGLGYPDVAPVHRPAEAFRTGTHA